MGIKEYPLNEEAAALQKRLEEAGVDERRTFITVVDSNGDVASSGNFLDQEELIEFLTFLINSHVSGRVINAKPGDPN